MVLHCETNKELRKENRQRCLLATLKRQTGGFFKTRDSMIG